jgi:hydroxylamine dehydrogenase
MGMSRSIAVEMLFVATLSFIACTPGMADEAAVSVASQDCIACHVSVTPGLVADWKKSLHARVTPAQGLKKPELERRVSAAKIPEQLAGTVVGCAECHTLNLGDHKDSFAHSETRVHLTLTPKDCATCHAAEAAQYEKNLMSHAWGNLANNPLYETLVNAVNGVQSFRDMKTTIAAPDEKTSADSCYHCHGTVLEVVGTEKRDTDFGEMEFPKLKGWPNQGVGRVNPDGVRGACTPCHSRHQFSIQVARKPYTCSQCHKGPDVPAYKAYTVSKHGNLLSSLSSEWNFKNVPWTVGKDFAAPTCAGCHVSLVVTEDNDVVAPRTHQMNDRLPWRLFGLIYAHPHPISPDTAIIRNKDGQPLPTTLTGEPAAQYLIGPDEQKQRRERLQKVCLACHSKDWVDGHWARLENTITTTNQMTRTATDILLKAWDAKVADKTNLFDEAIEKQWGEQWLFYGNSTRFASAMMGADYGVFDSGRWHMARTIQDMLDHLKFLLGTKGKKP